MRYSIDKIKHLVGKISKGDSLTAQLVFTNYACERFLERLSKSNYRKNFIIKGGILIASMVGIKSRSTYDIDITIKDFPLTEDIILRVAKEVILIDVNDGVVFDITRVESIMEESEYPGIRLNMNAYIDKIRMPLQIDFSSGDTITPKEIIFNYPLLFEDRVISLFAYPLETIIAEKIDSILSKGIANTRMRDYYDMYILYKIKENDIDYAVLNDAVVNTVTARKNSFILKDNKEVMNRIKNSGELSNRWERYQKSFDYAKAINFALVLNTLDEIFSRIEVLSK